MGCDLVLLAPPHGGARPAAAQPLRPERNPTILSPTLPAYRELDVSGSLARDPNLGSLARIPNLERLTLRRCLYVTDDTTRSWADAEPQRLKSLELGECPLITDESMAHLAQIPGLMDVRLHFAPVTDEGVMNLAQKPTIITNLALVSASITDEAIRIIGSSYPFRCVFAWAQARAMACSAGSLAFLFGLICAHHTI